MRAPTTMTALKLSVALALAVTHAGCANFSPDGGLSPVSAAVRVDLGKDIVKVSTDAEQQSASARVRALMKKRLTADRAVQIALLSNKGLQASFNDLGISEAQFFEASLPPNPTFSILSVSGGGQLKAIAALLKLTADTRRQYWRAVAAAEQTSYLVEARAAAETTSGLAKRPGETGALNKFDQGT